MRRLKSSAAIDARSSQRATVLRERPVRRAVAEMLTPSTRMPATWSNSFRVQRRPLYAVPVFRAERSPAYLATVTPSATRLGGKPAVATDGDAALSKVLALWLGECLVLDGPHRSSVPGLKTRCFTNDLKYLSATDQQRTAQAPVPARPRCPHNRYLKAHVSPLLHPFDNKRCFGGTYTKI